MKDKNDGLSSSPTENDDGFQVTRHRRTNSFSSFAKAYRSSKSDKTNRTSSYKLNQSASEIDDTQQLIAVLEHQVSEGEKARREMGNEIAKLKDQLLRAEAQITLLRQALINKEKYSQQHTRYPPRPLEVDLRLGNDSMDSPCSDSSQWTDPLNTTFYADSMHDETTSDSENEFNINTIINNISVNTYNNINNIQVNSIDQLNYILDINKINTTTNYTNTNNYHTTNNINTNTNVTTNNFPPNGVLSTSTPSGTPTSDNNISSSPNKTSSDNVSSSPSKIKDELNISEKDKKARLLNRTTTNHKRRGSDSDSVSKMDSYQRRHSEGKVLRIAGLKEQVSIILNPAVELRQAILQILNNSYAESEDEWPSVQALLQGVELADSVLPPPPRHLVHAGFVREGENVPEGYWIDDVLLLLFKDFLLVACQPKNDLAKAKYQFKEVVKLTPATRVHSRETDTEYYCIKIITEQCTRSFLSSSNEESEKWVSVLTKQIVLTVLSASQGNGSQYLIAPCEGYVIEQSTFVAAGETKLCLEEPRKSIYHYQSFFYSKPHINYVGGSSACPVVISIEDKTTRFALSPSILLRRNSDLTAVDSADSVKHRVLVRTHAGDECSCIAIPSNFARSLQSAHTEILAQLPNAIPVALPQLKLNTTLFRVKSSDLENDLVQYEANNMRRSHKIAVVYCAKGARTEAEMLQTAHAHASTDFHQFLKLLGTEVILKSFLDYNGGLDVKNDTDGTHSIFTNFWGIPIMFHVSTMLPNDHNNPNKKRHIGNDIVVVVFKDHDDDSLFVPSYCKDIFCVVQQVNSPTGGASYKVSFCTKEGIGGFLPALPDPPVFVKDAKFKHFLLAKIVNAERAAMRSAPFAKRHTLARFTFLKNLWRQYNVQPKEIDESCGQINTM